MIRVMASLKFDQRRPAGYQQQQQQCIYLQDYKVYNTLGSANSFYANLGRMIKTLNKGDIRNTITYRKKHLTYKFKYMAFVT